MTTIQVTLGPRPAVGGDAIGHMDDGKVVFVEDALPGERVCAEVTKNKRDYARAVATKILEPAPARVDPPCPHRRAGCGGCPWQEAKPESQVVYKQQVLTDALTRIAKLADAPLLPTVTLPTEGYRTTLHVALDAKGRPALRHRHLTGSGAQSTGSDAQSTGSDAHPTGPDAGLVGIDSCLIAHPDISAALAWLRLLGHEAVTLRVGVAGGEHLVVAQREVKQSTVDHLADRGWRVVQPDGDDGFTERVGGQLWHISARSFFQAGPAAAEAVAEAITAAMDEPAAGGSSLRPGDRLVDLYAGVGLLGGIVAKRNRTKLTAVESGAGASADARVNLKDVAAEVVRCEVGRWRARKAAAVIADPARSGLGRPGVTAVAATGARRLVLVSCDAASLARDVRLLAEAGYALRSIRPIDVLPHTTHTETVSRFDRLQRPGL